jgi:hypothetical protein
MVFFTLILSLVLGRITAVPVNEISTPTKHAVVVSEQLPWSPQRRLSWEDFKAVPDSLNKHHAVTSANLAVDVTCLDNKFRYTVRCVFLPTESWSKNKRSEKLLHHEQLHFDLTEVHARLLRRELFLLGTTCSKAKSNIKETVSSAFAAWKTDQQVFDKASDHGLNQEETKLWATAITKRLSLLEEFK